MNQQIEVANTIISQLKALDFWSMARWGANQILALEDKGTVCGGVRFKCSGSKVLRGGYAYIELNAATDTYTVRLVKAHGGNVKTLGEHTDVYVEDLVKTLDEMIG